MASNIFFSDTAIIAAVGAVKALLNSGTIKVYSGTQPADCNTAVTSQTLLATLTFSSTAFGSATASGSAGSKVVTATANSITSDTNAAATGTATWFRAWESGGTTAVLDGSVGTSGADLNLSTVSIIAGGTVECTGFTLSQPEQ